MCINDNDLQSISRDNLTKRQKNLCNDKLAINRDIICSVLVYWLSRFEKPVKCLEGVGICGANGLLWKRHFGKDVDVTVNGFYEEDFNIVTKNVELNKLQISVVKEDPCVLLRKNSYDFIYLNCETNAAYYFDSVFSSIKENSLLILTTSEDPSLYWQASEIALRNYGGVICKTSYHREVSVRLVMAEMARSAARYHKGLKINCTVVYKPQQSFTIIAEIKKGVAAANNCIENIKKLAYCSLCENWKFIPNPFFIDKVKVDLNCNCSKESEGKVIIGIGPLWADEIFEKEFIESVIKCLQGYPWKVNVIELLNLILEEARCHRKPVENPPLKKIKTTDQSNETSSLPYFYINTHRHSAKDFRLQKLNTIIRLLQKKGYCASKTHFDSEAVRSNATPADCVRILQESFINQENK